MRTIGCIFLALMAVTPLAQSEVGDFPNKPIRIIVPFTPGSSADNSSRFFGNQLANVLGQPFVIENRPGGEGAIAMTAVKNAPANGYTIMLASNSLMSVNPVVMKSLPYDPARNLKPIGGLTRGVNVLVVGAKSPFDTLADLVNGGKKDQRALNGGTYSAGYRLAAEWLATLSGMRFTNIPYKGASPVLTDVIGSQLDFAVVSLDGAAAMIKSGQLRALAISDDKRHAEFPDLPTIKESGYPEYVNYSWDAFYVRTETPSDIAGKLSAALQQVLASNATKEFVRKTGRELMPYQPDVMQNYQLSELERFRRIANAAGVKAE